MHNMDFTAVWHSQALTPRPPKAEVETSWWWSRGTAGGAVITGFGIANRGVAGFTRICDRHQDNYQSAIAESASNGLLT